MRRNTTARVIALGLAVLLPLALWGQLMSQESLGGNDTCSLLPKTGLSLYTLYLPQHEQYTAYYRYAVRDGASGYVLPQMGTGEQKHSLHAQGSTRFATWGAYGKAEYSHTQRRGVRGLLTAQPELFYPYVLIDTTQRDLTREHYQMSGVLNYQLKAWIIGFGGDFTGITQFGQRDPRPRSRLGDFTVLLALGYRLPWYALSLEGSYRYYSESFSLQNKQEDRQDPVYYHLGVGLYDHRLSLAKRTESLRYLFSSGSAVLQLAPLVRYCPLVQFAYRSKNSFGRSLAYTKLAEVFEQEVEGQLFLPISYGTHHLSLGGGVLSSQRSGYEIDYELYIVNAEPRISEQREYQRTETWIGQKTDYRGLLSYRNTTGKYQFLVDYVGSFGILNTSYKQDAYYFSQRAIKQLLSATCQRFFDRWDAVLNLQGYAVLPTSHKAKWANELPTFVRLSEALEYYYNTPRYQITAVLEGGYRFSASQRLALAITGCYAQLQNISRPAWGMEVALRYGFFKK